MDFKGFYPAGSKWKERVTSADGSVKILEFEVMQEREIKGMTVIPFQVAEEDKTKLYEKSTLNFVALEVEGNVVMASYPSDGRYLWPLEVGKKWTTNFMFFMAGRKSISVPKHYEVEAFETVTVPAGTFEAFRVMGVSGKKRENTIRLWWAPKANMTIRIDHFRGSKRIVSYETISLPK